MRRLARVISVISVSAVLGLAGASASQAFFTPQHSVCGAKSVVVHWTTNKSSDTVSLFGGMLASDPGNNRLLGVFTGSGSFNTGQSNYFWGFGSPYDKNIKSWWVTCSSAF